MSATSHTCANPRVRISEHTGRVFCATCREYLDARPQEAPETLRGDLTDETSIAPPDTFDTEGEPQTSGMDNRDPHAR